jgi:EmrB/QacA subfamily drug resistance transporter
VSGSGREQRPEAPVAPVRHGAILLAVALGSGIVFLDGTIVTVALETIGRDLPATFVGTLEGQTYVTGGYLVVLAALLIPAGALSDAYGRRRVFGLGLIAFGLTSMACGLAPTMELLVLFRLAQGAAGAFLVPGALAIITATFAGEERGRAIGIWAASTAAFTTFGPLVGGLLIQAVSWRAAFFVNVPLVIVALAALRYVPESRDAEATGRVDWLGAAVVIVAVGGLSFGATRGQEHGWQDPVAVAALVVGAVALVAFPILMAVRPNPLVPLDLFRRRNFAVVNLATLVIYGALYVSMWFQSLFLQGTIGYTPFAAGAVGLPSGILLALLSTRAGDAAGRVGPRPFMVSGPLLMAGGLLWFARIPSTSAAWLAEPGTPSSLVPPSSYLVDVLPATLLFGLGLALLVAPLTTALMGSVPVRRAGLGSAINNAVSRVGAPLAGAALFVVITATFAPAIAAAIPGFDATVAHRLGIVPLAPPPAGTPPDLADAITNASTDAFHLAMAVAAGLLVAGALINLVGLERRGSADGAEETGSPVRAVPDAA